MHVTRVREALYTCSATRTRITRASHTHHTRIAHAHTRTTLTTSSTDVAAEMALPLFAAADRFGVERLKRHCASRLEAGLGCEDACAVLAAADRRRAPPHRRTAAPLRSPFTPPCFPAAACAPHGPRCARPPAPQRPTRQPPASRPLPSAAQAPGSGAARALRLFHRDPL